VIAPLFAVTFACFETLQRFFAPGTSVPLKSLEEDLDAIRLSRIRTLDPVLSFAEK